MTRLEPLLPPPWSQTEDGAEKASPIPWESMRKATAPHRVSVIIPARNEERQIGAVLEAVLHADVWEVVVVDGQSRDRTRDVARSLGATVVSSPPGRGIQLRKGAEASTGDVLLFLHADTCVPPRYDDQMFRILARPGVSAGAFRLRIDSPGWRLRVIERLVNWRSRTLQMPYGDQAIFLTRDTFHRVGGFAALPVMEDFELMRRLRRRGRIAIAPVSVTTSARRWLRYGVWRTTLLNQACIAAYYLGVPIERIAAWRKSNTLPDADHSVPDSGRSPGPACRPRRPA